MDPTIRKFNYEALIRHVKQYPAVFDSKHEMHKNRAYVNELWRQIAEGLHSTDTLCREKWANLRSNYMRETRKLTIRRIEGKPLRITWPYFSLLEFLNPSFHKKISIDMALAAEPHDEQRLVIDLRSESNSNSHQGSDDIVEDAPTITVSSYCEENTGDNGEFNVKRKKRSWRQVDTSTTQNFESADNDTVEKVAQRFPQPQVRSTSDSCATCNEDNDRLFLLSLLPFMKQMNTRANLEFRTEVQQLLQKKITSK